MKPGKLKPGQRVSIISEFSFAPITHGTFIRREPQTAFRAARNIIRVDEFIGLRGKSDKGDTSFSDDAVSRRVNLMGKNNA